MGMNASEQLRSLDALNVGARTEGAVAALSGLMQGVGRGSMSVALVESLY